ncbi:MAG: M23 family metallopeptidase [Ornithinimicrobium sp.]|uniref:M23 family metallopeptidase n=1 Tax=Ornithinimicrobium sp. TaxID=1977084 RepID=UPI003D9B87D0
MTRSRMPLPMTRMPHRMIVHVRVARLVTVLLMAVLLGVGGLVTPSVGTSWAQAPDDERTPPGASTLVMGLAHLRDALVVASRQVTREGAVWEWPLTGQPAVVHRFDAPEQRWLRGHRGIDLGAFAGEPVRAVADGIVAFSGVIAGVGVVSVQHPDGLRSTYQPVQDRVERGEHVRAGQVLATLGPGGHCVVRACLHLGAKRGDTYLDPLLLLQRWEVSLLPLD